jgi:hypothetical protein
MRFTRPSFRELYNRAGRNVRGQRVSLQLQRGYVLTGGVRLKEGIETAAVTRSDSNGDGYDDLCTVSVGVGFTDTNQIRVYYPGESGAYQWEIRPINVSIASNIATITFNSWQIVDPDTQRSISQSPDLIDAEVAGNYLSTVDVYRVRNDPQTQVTFLWEEAATICACGSTCINCQLNTQTGCFHIRNDRLGLVAASPGEWNAANQQFSSLDWNDEECRAPDQALIHYYSGWLDSKIERPYVEMDSYWEYAVAYYAASLLDKDSCSCSNAAEFIHKWRVDVAHAGQQTGVWDKTVDQLANRLGTTKGALFAINSIRQPGRRIGGR